MKITWCKKHIGKKDGRWACCSCGSMTNHYYQEGDGERIHTLCFKCKRDLPEVKP